MKPLHLIFASLLLLSARTFAHGEDKAGPHNGFIRMPGAYHTEVLVEGKTDVRVYLLDMNFQNPITKDSSVKIRHEGHHATTANCEPRRDSFTCVFPAGTDLRSGKLVLNSTRARAVGNEAVYELPLKLKKSDTPQTGSPPSHH